MGLFSWHCQECNQAVTGPFTEADELNDIVVVTDDNKVRRGSYDGYGRVNDDDEGIFDFSEYSEHTDEKFRIFHRKCYPENIKFEDYGKPKSDIGQGHFYGPDQLNTFTENMEAHNAEL